MARRTKKQAAATRKGILDAAGRLFATQGIARTTLQDIATAAGVTRGAIYWHFDNKLAIFDALTEQVALHRRAGRESSEQSYFSHSLGELRNFVLTALDRTVGDPQARRTFEIVALKVEFTGEMDSILRSRAHNIKNWITSAERRILLAKQRGLVKETVDVRTVAFAMWMMVDGLVRTWMFDSASFDLVQQGQRMIDTYLTGLQN